MINEKDDTHSSMSITGLASKSLGARLSTVRRVVIGFDHVDIYGMRSSTSPSDCAGTYIPSCIPDIRGHFPPVMYYKYLL